MADPRLALLGALAGLALPVVAAAPRGSRGSLPGQLQGPGGERPRAPAHVLYVLEPFTVRFTLGDGTVRTRPVKAGEVLFSEAVMHSPVNIGDTDAHGILIELKEPATRSTTLGASGADAARLLTAVTFIRGVEGKEVELQRELLALTRPTRAEPGNLRYDLDRSVLKPNEFMRLEVWRDESALEAHKATPHLRASFEKRKQQGWATDITLWRRVPE